MKFPSINGRSIGREYLCTAKKISNSTFFICIASDTDSQGAYKFIGYLLGKPWAVTAKNAKFVI